MTTLGARLGFWLVLVIVGIAGGGWLMWGQVEDARTRASIAEQQVTELGKQLTELAARQARTDATLASRRRQFDTLQAQLENSRSDLQKVTRDDPASYAWAADCVPAAIADRLRLPADPKCAP